MLKYVHYIFLFALLLTVSCVSEEDVFNDESGTPVETSLMLSFLDYLQSTDDQSEKCFEFIYPFSILDNSENNITLINKDGLSEFINIQSDKFFSCSMVLPFKIKPRDADEVTVTNIDVFFNLLETCNIPLLNERIFNETNCFDYQYPIEIVSEINMNNKLVINSDEQLNNFVANPTFKYPITSYPIKSNQGTIISNKYQHMVILNDCEIAVENKVCPDFMIETIDFGTESDILNFIIRPENSKIPIATEWSIDGEIIEGETRAFLQFDFFNLLFSPETPRNVFEICAKTSFEDCTIEKEVCIITNFDNEVNQACGKDIDFITTEDPTTPGLLNFEAIFESDDPSTTNYVWIVDGDPIGDIFNTSSFQFTEPDLYSVCLIAREAGLECVGSTNSFPRVCKIITINDDLSPFNCSQRLDLFYEKDFFTTLGKFNFEAIYQSLDPTKTTYTWSLNNRIVIGNDTNKFSNTFANPNNYEICVTVNNPECPEDILIRECEIITVTESDLNP